MTSKLDVKLADILNPCFEGWVCEGKARNKEIKKAITAIKSAVREVVLESKEHKIHCECRTQILEELK